MASVISFGFAYPIDNAYSIVPVTDHAAIAQDAAEFVKTAVWQAKELATEIQSYVELANTYANAVQNTINLPMNAISQVQNQYYRMASIATQAQAIAGPDGTMMNRLNMLRSVGSQAGQQPGNIERSVEWWDKQRRDQMDENAKLLGLEEERRQVADTMLKAAAANGSGSLGAVQSMTAMNQTMQANASQIQLLNDQMRRQFEYEVQKDEMLQANQRQMHQDLGKPFDLTTGGGF